jgi:hypothetical protein
VSWRRGGEEKREKEGRMEKEREVRGSYGKSVK